MQLIFTKTIVEKIAEALADAKAKGRAERIEAIVVDKEEAKELYEVVFRYTSLRPFAYNRHENNLTSFMRDLVNPQSKILYMGHPVRLLGAK